MGFYIGGKTKNEWEEHFYSQFCQSEHAKKLFPENINEIHIRFPIMVVVETVFSTLEEYKLNPYRQYQLAIGFSNTYSITKEEFNSNKASFITSHDTLRQLYLKKIKMMVYIAMSYEINLPDNLDKYGDYISHVVKAASQEIAAEFQQKDVAIEVKNEHQKQYPIENTGKINKTIGALGQKTHGSSDKPSVTWENGVKLSV